MGERTIRIPRSKITENLGTLVGRDVNVLMLSGITHAGKVLSADATQIVVADVNADWTNNSRHQQRLALDDIHYLVYDLISAW